MKILAKRCKYFKDVNKDFKLSYEKKLEKTIKEKRAVDRARKATEEVRAYKNIIK